MTAVELPRLELTDEINYIAVFLTMNCNLNCTYCINDCETSGRRKEIFYASDGFVRPELTPNEWASALNRIPVRDDLPITLQGGEPMLYYGGKGIGKFISQTDHKFDLLTNFALKPELFVKNLNGGKHKFQRNSPYPSIRVSYHPKEMNRIWGGSGFEELVNRCEKLGEMGLRVSPVKKDSDVGIYMVEHPENTFTPEMKDGRVPFETKKFLGVHNGTLYGSYLYPYSTNLVSSGVYGSTLNCECRTSEILIDPSGFVWRCHLHLFGSWSGKKFTPIGNILDPRFSVDDIRKFRPCSYYGRCVGCDTKIKNNRFQSLDDMNVPHTSVEIRNIKIPETLKGAI